MRFIKTVGLAALVMTALMAFMGSTPAQADTEIVLCKQAKVLCPNGEIWPAGKIITGLAENITFLSGGNVKCTDSKMKGEVENEMGTSLLFKINEREIKGCGEVCTASFVGLVDGKFEVEATDNYFLTLNPTVKIVCMKMVECEYSATGVKLPIDNPLNGEPVALANEVELIWTGGGFFCEKKLKWDASYKFTGGALTILLSLFQL